MSVLKALRDRFVLEQDRSYLAHEGGCGFTEVEIRTSEVVELEDE